MRVCECLRLRKAAPRLDVYAIAHAPFFFPLLERNAHSTSLFELHFDKSICGHICAKFAVDQMFACGVKCIPISTVRTQQTRMSAVFTGIPLYLHNYIVFEYRFLGQNRFDMYDAH